MAHSSNKCKASKCGRNPILRPVYTNDWFGMSASTLALYVISWCCNPLLVQLTWFIKKSKQFNRSYIASDIAALMPVPSVNGPL